MSWFVQVVELDDSTFTTLSRSSDGRSRSGFKVDPIRDGLGCKQQTKS